MVHVCPECTKKWYCITDVLFQEILGKGGCEMDKESVCYDCQGIPEANRLKEIVKQEIRSGHAKIIGGNN